MMEKLWWMLCLTNGVALIFINPSPAVWRYDNRCDCSKCKGLVAELKPDSDSPVTALKSGTIWTWWMYQAEFPNIKIQKWCLHFVVLYVFTFVPISAGKCYSDNGRYYQGLVNTTTSGIPCQKWSEQVSICRYCTKESMHTICMEHQHEFPSSLTTFLCLNT